MLVKCSCRFLGATILIYMETKTGLQPCMHKGCGELTSETKVVNEPTIGVVQA